MFKVGQKVVCINSEPEPGRLWVFDDGPIEGAIYTVAALFVENDDVPCLQLEERPRHPFSNYRGYRASRFRPIVERKTDISIFREILRKATKQADTDIGASA